MKTIITTNDTDIAGIIFKKGNKTIDWAELSRVEQVKCLNSFYAYYDLYSKFVNTK